MDANIHLHILASGSKGNACVVEGPNGSVLIDCGISRRALLARADELGVDMGRVKALLITHEHSDHVSGVSVFARKFEGGIYATPGTMAARSYLAEMPFSPIAPGDGLHLAGMDVHVFHTSHDVADPVGFRFECGNDVVGYCTDTGVLTKDAAQALAGCRVLALESNHDIEMLKNGPYPAYLQARIRGAGGHLSNDQASNALPQLVCSDTQTVVAMHISEKNNVPRLAREAISHATGGSIEVLSASQETPLTVW